MQMNAKYLRSLYGQDVKQIFTIVGENVGLDALIRCDLCTTSGSTDVFRSMSIVCEHFKSLNEHIDTYKFHQDHVCEDKNAMCFRCGCRIGVGIMCDVALLSYKDGSCYFINECGWCREYPRQFEDHVKNLILPSGGFFSDFSCLLCYQENRRVYLSNDCTHYKEITDIDNAHDLCHQKKNVLEINVHRQCIFCGCKLEIGHEFYSCVHSFNVNGSDTEVDVFICIPCKRKVEFERDKIKKEKRLKAEQLERIEAVEIAKKIEQIEQYERGAIKKNVELQAADVEIQKPKESSEKLPECVVCLDELPTMICVPCGHKCLCQNCSTKIESKCPICKQQVTQTIKVFDC